VDGQKNFLKSSMTNPTLWLVLLWSWQ